MYLITGGAGFIGSNIAEVLVKNGHRVRILDNFYTGKKENLASISNDVELIEGDLRDIDTVIKAMSGISYVFHYGAIASVQISIADPIGSNATNIGGTLNVLTAARKSGVLKVVLASSSSVYGDDPRLPKNEEMKPVPLSPYALHKLAGEVYGRQFSTLFGLSTVSLRFFNVYGPKQDPQGLYSAVIPKFLTLAMADEAPIIYGDGNQTRDFIHIDDVVRANLLSLDATDLSGAQINIASGKGLSLNEFVTTLSEVLGKTIHPIFKNARPGDIMHSVADISLADKVMGFHPEVEFRRGLESYAKWYDKFGR